MRLCLDRTLIFNPRHFGFIPSALWTTCEVTFGDLVTDFFQRKNNGNCRFVHKLYNALQITRVDALMFPYFGVQWLSNTVMKVDKRAFAQLLGIRSIQGALFHLQGNFPSHGFVEVGQTQALEQLAPEQLQGIDFERVRLVSHQERIFVADATEKTILNCSWTQARTKV
jgi:hypothetical protein